MFNVHFCGGGSSSGRVSARVEALAGIAIACGRDATKERRKLRSVATQLRTKDAGRTWKLRRVSGAGSVRAHDGHHTGGAGVRSALGPFGRGGRA